jgi:amino acid transporter
MVSFVTLAANICVTAILLLACLIWGNNSNMAFIFPLPENSSLSQKTDANNTNLSPLSYFFTKKQLTNSLSNEIFHFNSL